MERLSFEEIIKKLQEGSIIPQEITDGIKSGEIYPFRVGEVREILTYFKEDKDKVKLCQYNIDGKILIINNLEKKESVIEAIQYISDEDKLNIIKNHLDDDDSKKQVIEKLSNEKQKLLVKMMMTRENAKQYFLPENRKYNMIGLDPKITIGIEIESDSQFIDNLSQDILKLGKILGNGSIENYIGWETKGDMSFISDTGVEIVSPILNDSPESVEDVYMVCEMLKQSEMGTSKRCGGHIHIGSDYLKSKEAFGNLYEIWCNTEKILYLISNKEGELPREGIETHAAPISENVRRAIEEGKINIDSEESLDEFIKGLQTIQGKGKANNGRASGLNLLNINNGKNTIEFRTPNGSLEPKTWVENVKLFGRIIQISERIAQISQKTKVDEEDLKLIKLIEELKKDISEEEKMEVLLEMLFSEEEKIIYRQRYNSNVKLFEYSQDESMRRLEFSERTVNIKEHILPSLESAEKEVGDKGDIFNEEENDMKESNEKISANEAAKMLLERDEEGKYVIGELNGISERENLTRVVGILNQVNLAEADDKGFENIRKALGIIGAYDRYGYLNPQEKISSLGEFYEKSKNGDMAPARMYVNKFLGNMDTFSRAEIDDKFSDVMEMWVGISEEMLEKNTNISMNQLTKGALAKEIRISEIGDGQRAVEEPKQELEQ